MKAMGILRKMTLMYYKWDDVVYDTVIPLSLCWQPNSAKSALYDKGIFCFVNHTVRDTSSPFVYPENTPDAWVEYAHGFRWMYDISIQSLQKNPHWMWAWEDSFGTDYNGIAWRPHVVASRLCVWLSRYQDLCHMLNQDERDDFNKLVSRHYRYLTLFHTQYNLEPHQSLQAWGGLVCGILSLHDTQTDYKYYLNKILECLSRIMDEDGCVMGNMSVHMQVLSLCLEVRSRLYKMKISCPDTLDVYVDKMWRVVRFFYQTNADFCHMAGANGLVCDYDSLRRLCKNEQGIVSSLVHAGHYVQRSDTFNVYVDASPRTQNHVYDGGVLGVTISYQKNPLFVACGYSHALGDVCRYSACFNTLVINNVNAVSVLDTASDTSLGIQAQEYTQNEWQVVSCKHTGYLEKFGVRVERDVCLNDIGNTIRGQDRLVFCGNQNLGQDLDIAVRFHIHPDVKANVTPSGAVAMIIKKTNMVIFQVKNATISLEKSFFVDTFGESLPTEQIVVRHAHTVDVLDDNTVSLDWQICLDT